ncbi:NYN domain-containing protein [Pseudanabaena sp. 'Roaring Creek']|uniref:LabA-like NYN domain-containing protein n=1 Tax=Pseudanabaena sp. 'Roaring Creek' TaxID=1681830 RepID=UPI0006D7F553|nr:NYN domain-containing protein [Pseudanabaena sp. 'Roaring Creek']
MTTVHQNLVVSTKDSLLEMPRNFTGKPLKLCGERIVMFVDDSNLFYALRKIRVRKDLKIYQDLRNRLNVEDIYIYMSLNPESETEKKLIRSLRRISFHVHAKPIVQRLDGTRKANLDVEITWAMCSKADSYDVVILVSGDGDFCWAVKRLKQMGKCVVVVGLNSMTSPLLKNAANSYVDLESLFDIKAS